MARHAAGPNEQCECQRVIMTAVTCGVRLVVIAFISVLRMSAQSLDPVIGSGDLIKIERFNKECLQSWRLLRVDQDGTIVLPLVGRVRVEGLTASQSANTIKTKLANFLSEPSVSIAVVKAKEPGPN